MTNRDPMTVEFLREVFDKTVQEIDLRGRSGVAKRVSEHFDVPPAMIYRLTRLIDGKGLPGAYSKIEKELYLALLKEKKIKGPSEEQADEPKKQKADPKDDAIKILKEAFEGVKIAVVEYITEVYTATLAENDRLREENEKLNKELEKEDEWEEGLRKIED